MCSLITAAVCYMSLVTSRATLAVEGGGAATNPSEAAGAQQRVSLVVLLLPRLVDTHQQASGHACWCVSRIPGCTNADSSVRCIHVCLYS